MSSTVNFEPSQLESSKDVCRCMHCNAESSITVFPDLPKNKWKCEVCKHANIWKPSETYAQVYGFGSAQPPVFGSAQPPVFGSAQPPCNDDLETKPNKKMGKFTLDALAKMDRGDVNNMTSCDALDALMACDDSAGKLNEAIGVAAQKGYSREFLSGVIGDIGRLRDLKQLLHDKLDQEVV